VESAPAGARVSGFAARAARLPPAERAPSGRPWRGTRSAERICLTPPSALRVSTSRGWWRRKRSSGDFGLVGTPEAIIEGLHRYAEVSQQYVTFHMPDAQEISGIRLLGETAVPAVAGFYGLEVRWCRWHLLCA
jgi:alkanesulfonate monooxygenase SsuD/methylene tetrahydromethanopterin reductase-like flavin-dependent oxidoreductase (luciferase family)